MHEKFDLAIPAAHENLYEKLDFAIPAAHENLVSGFFVPTFLIDFADSTLHPVYFFFEVFRDGFREGLIVHCSSFS